MANADAEGRARARLCASAALWHTTFVEHIVSGLDNFRTGYTSSLCCKGMGLFFLLFFLLFPLLNFFKGGVFEGGFLDMQECLMLMAEKIKWVKPPKAVHGCAARSPLLLRSPEAERDSSQAWGAPACIIPSPPLHEAWGTDSGMGLRTVRLPGWQQKPAGPLLGTHSWSTTPAPVSPLLPSRHSAPLSTPPAPQNIALHSFCSLNSAAPKTSLLHDDEEVPPPPLGAPGGLFLASLPKKHLLG
jgi:hypothetical protein